MTSPLGEAIFWIEKQLQQGKEKVLVNCRTGIGRRSSVGLAYCFDKYPPWSYRPTLDVGARVPQQIWEYYNL